jgi:hypothetical protein
MREWVRVFVLGSEALLVEVGIESGEALRAIPEVEGEPEPLQSLVLKFKSLDVSNLTPKRDNRRCPNILVPG